MTTFWDLRVELEQVLVVKYNKEFDRTDWDPSVTLAMMWYWHPPCGGSAERPKPPPSPPPPLTSIVRTAATQRR
jgi:hypothetical protein